MTSHYGSRGHSPSGGGPRSRPPSTSSQLPQNYLSRGYFDEKGNPYYEVIIDWPQQLAGCLAEKDMSSSQLRNFFAELRRIESQLDTGKSFAEVKHRLYKLDGFAQNAVSRRIAPPLFRDFVRKNIEWAKDEKSFREGFLPHFESLVAYFPKKR